LSKSGASVTVGKTGLSVNLGKDGATGNVGIPGTGPSQSRVLLNPNRVSKPALAGREFGSGCFLQLWW